MTRNEASRRFCVSEEKLLYYEKNGLFDCHKQADGSIDYCDRTAEYISLIELLIKAGLDMEMLKAYLCGLGNEDSAGKEQIEILIKQRYALLDDIHNKEKILNQLDFVIREAKKKNRGEMI